MICCCGNLDSVFREGWGGVARGEDLTSLGAPGNLRPGVASDEALELHKPTPA